MNYLLSVYADSLSHRLFETKCFQNQSLQDNDEIAVKGIVGILFWFSKFKKKQLYFLVQSLPHVPVTDNL